jgi:hypothetical protein
MSDDELAHLRELLKAEQAKNAQHEALAREVKGMFGDMEIDPSGTILDVAIRVREVLISTMDKLFDEQSKGAKRDDSQPNPPAAVDPGAAPIDD